MDQVDVERSQEFRKCIECFLCQNNCHVVRDHEENKPNFASPRFFIRYAELDMHPLDTVDRKTTAQADAGLGYCNITKCCSEVCPEHIHITDNGIIPMKERVVDTKYDPVLFLGSKIGLRKESTRTVVGPAAGSGPSPIKHPQQLAGGEAVSVAAPPASESALRKAAIPAAAATGGAAGVGFLAWALRRRRTS
jgi:succinate dehydrogenase / fumarate reductase iron-sulfur subunit